MLDLVQFQPSDAPKRLSESLVGTPLGWLRNWSQIVQNRTFRGPCWRGVRERGTQGGRGTAVGTKAVGTKGVGTKAVSTKAVGWKSTRGALWEDKNCVIHRARKGKKKESRGGEGGVRKERERERSKAVGTKAAGTKAVGN